MDAKTPPSRLTATAGVMPHQEFDPGSARVLVVEDDFINQRILAATLTQHGYPFRLAASGEEALAVVNDYAPDLILMDVVMPGIDGYTVVRRLKENPRTRQIPTVLVTALNDRESRLAGLEAGAEEFVSKPIDQQEIAIRLRNLIRLKKYQDFLQHHTRVLARYDSATGLPNRSLFHDHLIHAISNSADDRREVGLLLLELGEFKRITDALGQAAGVELLGAFLERVTGSLNGDELVARLEGSEFAILFTSSDLLVEMHQKAARLLHTLDQPFTWEGREIQLTAALGGSRHPTDARSAQELERKASLALHHARRNQRNGFLCYAPGMDQTARERLDLEFRLHTALEREELELYYQPKIEAFTGRLVGMEALMRWTPPDREPIPPGRFIPIAEETGLIIPMGSWALRTACHQTQRWRQEGLELTVAVNLSPRQFLNHGLLEEVTGALAASGLPPHCLELEVTESCVVDNLTATVELLQRLRALGVSCALDDFGTGFSSLNLLRQLPLDTLKLDRSFIQPLPGEKVAASIVRTLVSMARTLGLRVVAEGVENPSQYQFLWGISCDHLQGYLFSPPLPAPAFANLARHALQGQSTGGPFMPTAITREHPPCI